MGKFRNKKQSNIVEVYEFFKQTVSGSFLNCEIRFAQLDYHRIHYVHHTINNFCIPGLNGNIANADSAICDLYF